MKSLRYRQIHLDFHTSPDIPDIGKSFDVEYWVRTFKEAAVNSVTLFATCHHGWSYYDTEVGQRHPHLHFDLLRQQFNALKASDINAPIYLTAGVNDWAAHLHPEWREVDHSGSYSGWNTSPLEPGFKKLCFNTPYLNLLCRQIEEVVTLFPDNDGIFLDIIFQGSCCCTACMDSMAKKGYDATSAKGREAHGKEVLARYYERTTAAARSKNSETSIFHNSGHVTVGDREILKHFSHLELESLPTGGWGYDHFPMSAKYTKTLNHEVLGMTGKFHTTWGEFGGFKHPNALRYECASMLAFGTKCSIGDQLHPCGKLDETTYRLIGEAYREVRSKEPWCEGAKGLADVAILSGAAINGVHGREHAGDVGAGRILLEAQIQFDLIDAQEPLDAYKLIILPDDLDLSDLMVTKLQKFIDAGGKIYATGTSGWREQTPLFDFGARFESESSFSPNYAMPHEVICPQGISTPFVMYGSSQKIKATSGESLGEIYEPYFNRDYRHFCSHQHTPFKTSPCSDVLGVKSESGIVMAHALFSLYRGYGAVVHKEMVVKGIKSLLGEDELFRSNLPSMARAVLNEQTGKNRTVLHLLFANTIARGGKINLAGGTVSGEGLNIEVIEDLLPLDDIEVSLKLEQKVRSVTLQPEGHPLDFKMVDGRINFVVPKVLCHQIVCLKWV